MTDKTKAREGLEREINKMLDELAEAERPWVGSWITGAVIEKHQKGLSRDPDRPWWEGNNRDHVFDAVRRVINKRAGDPDLDDEDAVAQPTLPGFMHVHHYYRTKRWFKDGEMVKKGTKGAEAERVGVRIEDMTDEEIMAKARLYARNSRSLAEHSDELLRYLEERRRRRGAA